MSESDPTAFSYEKPTESGKKRSRFKLSTTQVATLATILLAGAGYDQFRVEETRQDSQMFDQHLDTVRERLDELESRFTDQGDHDHIMGPWSPPQQVAGNFVTPQFYKYRQCKLCGEPERLPLR